MLWLKRIERRFAPIRSSHITHEEERIMMNAQVGEIAGSLIRLSGVYDKLFGKRPDFSALRIPKKPEGVGSIRLIVVAREILTWTDNRPLQGTQEALKRHFRCWQYVDDLDREITANDRNLNKGSYAVWVRDVREADDDLKKLSADDLAEKGVPGIIVLERQLLEADYFFELGTHPDQENATLCPGSRDRDGRVPDANWGGGKFNIYYCGASLSYPCVRCRRVWA